jgi:hypothetical protein
LLRFAPHAFGNFPKLTTLTKALTSRARARVEVSTLTTFPLPRSRRGTGKCVNFPSGEILSLADRGRT